MIDINPRYHNSGIFGAGPGLWYGELPPDGSIGAWRDAPVGSVYVYKAGITSGALYQKRTNTDLSADWVAFDAAPYGQYNVVDYGAVGDGTTDDSAAIQAAIDAAAGAGVVIVPGNKTYYLGSQIVVDCNFDARGATFKVANAAAGGVKIDSPNYPDTNPTKTSEKLIFLPDYIYRTSIGWDDVEPDITSVGVQIHNTDSCTVFVGKVANFYIGLKLSAGDGVVGCSYNQIHLRMFSNNLIANALMPEGAGLAGWVNENTFYGGRFYVASSYGTGYTGCKHIYIAAPEGGDEGNPVNNNLWLHPSLEGNAPEFHVDFFCANSNTIIQPRAEASAGWRVRFNGTAGIACNDNAIYGYGFGVDQAIVTYTGNASANIVVGARTERRIMATDDGAIVASGLLDRYPLIVMMPSSAPAWSGNPQADYVFRLKADQMEMKATGDTYWRMLFDYANGYLKMGDGTLPEGSMHYLQYRAGRIGVNTSSTLAYGTQAAHVADASTSHALNATFSDTEVEAALNALGTKLNSVLAALEAFAVTASA